MTGRAMPVALLLAAAGAAAAAADPGLPTDAQVGEMRIQIDRELLPRLERQLPGNPAPDAPPNIPGAPGGARQVLPQVPAELPVGADVGEIVRMAPKADAGAAAPRSGLLVLVSFALPPGSLRALVAQAARADAVLALRGLKDDSFRATALEIARLNRAAGRKAAWMVDPLLFRELGIQAVPVFAVFDGPQAALVAGDVPVGHALETIGRDHPGRIRQAAERIARRLRDG